jgi:hypothetical protein
MILSIKERIELLRQLRTINGSVPELELVKTLYEKIDIPEKTRAKLEVKEDANGYFIGMEQDEDITLTPAENEWLKKLHGVIEARNRVNLNNLTLFQKLRDITLPEAKPVKSKK